MKNIKDVIKRTLRIFHREKIIGISVFTNRKDIKMVSFSKSEIFNMPEYRDIFGNVHEGFNSYKTKIPDYYVLRVNRGKCIVGFEEVYTKDNKVLLEITSQKNNPSLNSNIKKLKNVVSINGSVANLSLSGLENNYYHFLVEFSARLFMLKKLNIKPDYYIYPMNTTFQKDFLIHFGIDNDKVINLNEGTTIQAEILIAPALINNWEPIEFRNVIHYQKQYLPYWISDIYNDLILPRKGNKYIYISRKFSKYRKVINEEIFIDFLKSKNFEIYYLENYTVNQQIEIFNQCSALIAPHGAGLINMCYCAPGIRILELFPKYYHDHGLILQALMLKHKYNYLIGDTLNTDGIPPQQEDIIIDIKLFTQAVELLLSQ
jgi:hypothetical protein